MQQLWQFFDIHSLEQGVVVILQLLFAFLNEALVGAPEQFPRGEHRQLIFILAFFAADVEFSHVTEPFFEGPMLVLFGVEDLCTLYFTSMVYQTVPLSFWALVNLTRYFGSLIILDY